MRVSSGSSPRGRGTESTLASRCQQARFIPAWAGNSDVSVRKIHPRAVHPRVGGEQAAVYPPSRSTPGSSPRARGTDLLDLLSKVLCRFIPAWAGNSREPARPYPWQPVHPRVGGEQALRRHWPSICAGSSPRGRGTGIETALAIDMRRFIPAWAGNRGDPGEGAPIISVHPRVGGEQSSAAVSNTSTSGSSPRGRGTASQAIYVSLLMRFIPAWAGNRRHSGRRSS